jgi:hypothetical protein
MATLRPSGHSPLSRTSEAFGAARRKITLPSGRTSGERSGAGPRPCAAGGAWALALADNRHAPSAAAKSVDLRIIGFVLEINKAPQSTPATPGAIACNIY